MINSITETCWLRNRNFRNRNLLNQIEESEQFIDFPTVKVTCYYFEDCRRSQDASIHK